MSFVDKIRGFFRSPQQPAVLNQKPNRAMRRAHSSRYQYYIRQMIRIANEYRIQGPYVWHRPSQNYVDGSFRDEQDAQKWVTAIVQRRATFAANRRFDVRPQI